MTGLPLTYGWQERGSCTLVCYDLVYRNSAFPFGWLNNHLDGLGFALFFIGLLHLFVCMCMCVGTLEIRGQLCCLVYPRDQTQFSQIANLYPLTGLTGSSFILFVVFCFALLLQCQGLNS